MKAVVLARGLGSRMKQAGDGAALSVGQASAAAAGAKGMMPIDDLSTSPGAGAPARPFLDFVLSALADAGCQEVCFVVAPDHAAIRDYYDGTGRPTRLRIHYAIQSQPDGTARAVLSAETFAGAEPFLVLNSDNLYSVEVLHTLIHLCEPGLPAYERDSLVTESGFAPDRVAAFAAIDVDTDGYLTRIVEKPGQDYSNTRGVNGLISMNVWRFDARIFDACRAVALSTRGEYELPEAVALAITRGMRFKTFRARGAVLDLSRRSDVSLVSRRLSGVRPRP